MLVTASAGAQDSKPARATVSGTVFDSLVTNRPLAGAEVVVEGTELSTLTDSAGRFRIAGVPPGRAVLRFYHTTLDSLGFSAAPVGVTVADSGSVQVRLATPSAATVYGHLCPGTQAPSTGVLLGRVRDVDAHAPLPNADITVRWGEWTVGLGALSRTERRVDARGAAFP